jgi:phage shock protein C
MAERKKLYRSSKNKYIAGVCGGIGEFFNIDPSIIRILWAASIICYGSGILLYIIAWLLIPKK